MPIFGMNETVDRLAMANSVRSYGHLLSEDGHIWTRALEVKVKHGKKAEKDMKG